MAESGAVPRHRLLRRAVELSGISIFWSGAVGGVAAVLGLTTGSLSLLGFGLDAAIDSAASLVLVWRFSVERRDAARAEAVERIAERLVGITLIAVAVFMAIGSVRNLSSHAEPERSPAAVVLLVLSVLLLPPLALAKRRVAARLESGALRADSVLTAFAALLAGIGLASVLLSDLFGFWWADSVAALVIAVLVAREGLFAIVSSREAAPH